jgi:hypothetical protein
VKQKKNNPVTAQAPGRDSSGLFSFGKFPYGI